MWPEKNNTAMATAIAFHVFVAYLLVLLAWGTVITLQLKEFFIKTPSPSEPFSTKRV